MGGARRPERLRPGDAIIRPLAGLVATTLLLGSCVSGSVVGVGETPVPEQQVPASGRQLVVAVVDPSGTPLPGATVTFTDPAGGHIVLSDNEGMAAFNWTVGPVSISAELVGLLPGEAVVVERPEEPFSLALHPVVLRGVVTDPAGYQLSNVSVTSGTVETVSGPDGGFELARAVPGEVVASHPARVTSRREWNGTDGSLDMVMQPRIVRALHVSAAAASNPSSWEHLLALGDSTVVNGLVIDLKDDTGRVFYDSQVEVARQAGAVMDWFRLSDVLADTKERGLYAIGRIVAFIDPLVARTLPGVAVWDQRRDAPFVSNSLWYLDPSDEEARSYAISLALEACAAGFSEIQFDHVAFPLTQNAALVFDAAGSEAERASALRSFAAEASTRLGREGCASSVNVLGSTMTVQVPGSVGQDFKGLSQVVDVLAPTVYPSAYSEDWFGFEDPSDHPGRVVGLALDDGLQKINGPAILRPWLQDFSYGASAVKAQIASAESRGLGWMLWNAASSFTEAAIDAESTLGSEEPEA